MYLHLGGGTVVRQSEVVAVCDLDNASWSNITREYLAAAERAGVVVNVAEDIPKSFVLCCSEGKRTLYLSHFSPAYLAKKAKTFGYT